MTLPRTGSRSRRLQLLAEFRHQLRLFYRFSELAAQRLGLQPQQHQLLLQIAGAPDGASPTIRYAAERLGLRHNTVVELIDRCEEAGLLTRVHDAVDRRCVLLELSPGGRQMLDVLSTDHAKELSELAPRLIHALTAIGEVEKGPPSRTARRAG